MCICVGIQVISDKKGKGLFYETMRRKCTGRGLNNTKGQEMMDDGHVALLFG